MRLPRLQLSDGEIDLEVGKIYRSGKTFPLEAIEIRLLDYLAKSPSLVPLEELQREVWGFSPQVESRAVYFAVRRLRSRLEADPKTPTILIGTEGSGFGLCLASTSSTLIGRNRDIAYIRQQLVPGALVLLTGPAGVGKSSVLAEFSKDSTGIQVNAHGIVQAHDLARQIAHAFGGAAHNQPIDGLERILSVQSVVTVILDHLDDLDPDALDTLVHWQYQAPHIRWLLASRAPLSLPKMIHIPIAPLDLVDAKTLFYQRWQATRAPHSFQEAELEELLVYLDGLPLAIEISTWQARILPLRQIRDGLLNHSDVSLIGPYGSLGASISMSWGRLTIEERVGLARLCDLNVAVPLDAALATMGLSPSALARLVEHGLVRLDAHSQEPLYAPFYTVQWFIRQQHLHSNGCERLAEWWLTAVEGSQKANTWSAVATHGAVLNAAKTLIDRQNIELGGPLAVVCLDHAHLYSMSAAHQVLAAKLETLSLEPLISARWKWRRARLLNSDSELLASFQVLRSVAPKEEVITNALDFARYRIMKGDILGSAEVLEWAREASGPGGDFRIEIHASILAKAQGKLSEAIAIAERVTTQARIQQRGLPLALGYLGSLYKDRGLPEEALALTTEAIGLASEITAREAAQVWHYHAGSTELAGLVDKARHAYRQVMHFLKPLPNHGGLGFITTIINLAWLELDNHQPEAARRLLLEHFPLATQKPELFATFQIHLELSRLRCGYPPTHLDTEAMLAATRSQAVADEATLFGFCAEIALHSGQYANANRYIQELEARIQQMGLTPASFAGKLLASILELRKQNSPTS